MRLEDPETSHLSGSVLNTSGARLNSTPKPIKEEEKNNKIKDPSSEQVFPWTSLVSGVLSQREWPGSATGLGNELGEPSGRRRFGGAF